MQLANKIRRFAEFAAYDVETTIFQGAFVRHPTISTLLAAVVLAAAGSAPVRAADAPVPPVAAKAAWQESRHGEVVTDDYRWLHKKDDPDVIAHLTAENAYTDAVTADIKPLADKLYAEIKGRMQEVDLSVPARGGGRDQLKP
ncbi:MAG: hypothetical protein ABWY27_19915, partial [Telluria sp.]